MMKVNESLEVLNSYLINMKNPNKLMEIIQFLNIFEPYYVLTLVLIGLIGNTISFSLFVFTKLRFNPANLLLAALAFVDNWFLIALLIVTLKHFRIDLFDRSLFICKFNVYSTFVSSFLSIWFIVAFSIQRLIVVYFPLKRYEFCSKYKTKLIIFFISLFGFIYYSFAVFMSGFEENYDQSCVTLKKWFDIVRILVFIDTLQTMVVPFILISLANFLIVCKLMKKISSKKSFKKRAVKKMSDPVDCDENKNGAGSNISRRGSYNFFNTNTSEKNAFIIAKISKNVIAQNKRQKSYSETTKTLVVIASFFLILNSPMAASKTYYFFKRNFQSSTVTLSNQNNQINTNFYELTNRSIDSNIYANDSKSNGYVNENSLEEMETNQIEEIIERISCFIYYINYSLNFFLYTFNTKQFRENILMILKKPFKK